MSGRPFLCPNCGNWYTPIPEFKGQCRQCVMGTHAPHHKTGLIDCHFGQESSTFSERRMVETMNLVVGLPARLSSLAAGINTATTSIAVNELLLEAERLFSGTEKAMRGIGEVMSWAGVMELPGQADATPAARFKDLASIEEMAGNSRRPPEDVATLKRSVAICKEIEDELTNKMAEIRVAMNEVRRMATSWGSPQALQPIERGIPAMAQQKAVLPRKGRRTAKQLAYTQRQREEAVQRRKQSESKQLVETAA